MRTLKHWVASLLITLAGHAAGHSHAPRECVGDLPGWQLVEAVDDLPAD
jgi:hypothetical protein